MIRNTRKESYDDYLGVVFTHGDHRVALCRDGLQWLLQQKVNRSTGATWQNLSYCVTAKALTREWHRKIGSMPPPEITIALPDAHKASVQTL